MNPFRRSLAALAARQSPNAWRDYADAEEREDYEDDQDEESDEEFAARMTAKGLIWNQSTHRWVNK